MLRFPRFPLAVLGICLALFAARSGLAQDAAEKSAEKADTEAKPAQVADAGQAELFKKFAERMSGVRLTGQFTIDGKEAPPAKEEYVIQSVSKLPQGDLWLFTAQIKYGDRDVTVPMPLPVKWAGDTPVISLSDVTIPGLGTFSARVVLDGDRYAGTWQHGKVGGHLFGTIAKKKDE